MAEYITSNWTELYIYAKGVAERYGRPTGPERVISARFAHSEAMRVCIERPASSELSGQALFNVLVARLGVSVEQWQATVETAWAIVESPHYTPGANPQLHARLS